MNQDRIYNAITKAITAAGTLLSAHGAFGATTSQWQEITGGLLALAAVIYSDYYNKPTTPASTTPPKP